MRVINRILEILKDNSMIIFSIIAAVLYCLYPETGVGNIAITVIFIFAVLVFVTSILLVVEPSKLGVKKANSNNTSIWTSVVLILVLAFILLYFGNIFIGAIPLISAIFMTIGLIKIKNKVYNE